MEHFLDPSEDWVRNAACRGIDPNLFFPVGTNGPAIEQIESAKAICNQCNSQIPCLEFALITKQDYGVWGGKTEEERRKIRKNWINQRRRTT